VVCNGIAAAERIATEPPNINAAATMATPIRFVMGHSSMRKKL
jgi:hypothetical protein